MCVCGQVSLKFELALIAQARVLGGSDGDAWNDGNGRDDGSRFVCAFHQAKRGRSALEVSSCKAHGRAVFDVMADVS